MYKKIQKCHFFNLYIANASVLSSSVLQVRSRTAVHGRAATGVSPDRMSSPDTTGNTPEPNPSSASPAAAASRALTTWPCTWSATRINTDIPVYTNTCILPHKHSSIRTPEPNSIKGIMNRCQNHPRVPDFTLALHGNISWVVVSIVQDNWPFSNDKLPIQTLNKHR